MSASRPETDVDGCATRSGASSRRRALRVLLSDGALTIFFHLKFKQVTSCEPSNYPYRKICSPLEKAFFSCARTLGGEENQTRRPSRVLASRRHDLSLLALCHSNALLEFGRRHKLEAPAGRSPRLLGWRAHAPARRAHRRPTAIAGVNRRSAARALREATAKRGATVEMPRLEAAATVSRALPVARKGSGPNEAGAGTRDRAVVISETGAGATTAGMGTGAMAGETFEGGSVVQIVRLQSENRSPRARRVARTSLRSSWRR